MNEMVYHEKQKNDIHSPTPPTTTVISRNIFRDLIIHGVWLFPKVSCFVCTRARIAAKFLHNGMPTSRKYDNKN